MIAIAEGGTGNGHWQGEEKLGQFGEERENSVCMVIERLRLCIRVE